MAKTGLSKGLNYVMQGNNLRGNDSILGIVMCLGLLIAMSAAAKPSAAPTAKSSLGINLAPITYYSSEQPFINILKTAYSWTTHGDTWDTEEERYLNLDADGYPISLSSVNEPHPQKFTSVGVVLLTQLPTTAAGTYPAGNYVVLYEGKGTIDYGLDAVLVSRSPGRDVFAVAKPSTAGIDLRISATDPARTGDYLRNIRVVKADDEAAAKAGRIFNAEFLSRLRSFRALRFMDWLATNGNEMSSWSDRPLPSQVFWGTPKGVPLEIAIALANALSADAWFNTPVKADDDYLTRMAGLVKARLNPRLKAYVELSNEVWNPSFTQNGYSIAQGQAAFPKASANKYELGWEWYGMRVARLADLWRAAFGGTSFASRVVIVMAGQAANPAVLKAELSTPDWKGAGHAPAARHHIGVAAIAPYFFSLPEANDVDAILKSADGGMAELFSTTEAQGPYSSVPAGGSIGQATGWVKNHVSLLAAYRLPLVAYEGGQSLVGFPKYQDGSALVNLLIAANRDPRMHAAYMTYLKAWKAAGGTLFVHYHDIGIAGQYGEWGALESLMQPVTPAEAAPPKWRALQEFGTQTACWWPRCGGRAR
jgi:hypothetical protein